MVQAWQQLHVQSGHCPNSNCLLPQNHLTMKLSCLLFLHLQVIMYCLIEWVWAFERALPSLPIGGLVQSLALNSVRASTILKCSLFSFSLCCMISWFIGGRSSVVHWYTWKIGDFLVWFHCPQDMGNSPQWLAIWGSSSQMSSSLYLQSNIEQDLENFPLFQWNPRYLDSLQDSNKKEKEYFYDIPSIDHRCSGNVGKNFGWWDCINE